MSNPYDPPEEVQSSSQSARAQLFAPALAILTTSILWAFGMMFGAAWYMSMAADHDRYVAFTMYAVLFGLYNGLIATGAFTMLRTGSYLWACTTAILTCIPGLGPCYLLGLPLGIWALVVLRRPEVRASFKRM